MHEVSSLHSSGSGERPAGSARSLVLDGGDSSLLSPVHSLGGISVDGGGTGSTGLGVLGASAELETELVLSHISKLVHAHRPGEVLSVVELDLLQVALVDGETVSLLLHRAVVLVEVLLVLKESSVTEIHTQRNGEQSEDESLHITYESYSDSTADASCEPPADWSNHFVFCVGQLELYRRWILGFNRNKTYGTRRYIGRDR